MPSAERRYRATALDRVFADTRIVTAVGPVRGLDIERTRRTLAAAERVDDAPHVALEPRSDARQWHYRNGIAGDNVISSTAATEDLGRVLTDIRARGGERGPLEVIVFDDYLAVDYSHGIGDGQIGVMMLAAFCDDADGALVPGLAAGIPAGMTWKALWRHYSRNPRTLGAFWKLRARHRAQADADTPRRRIDNWEDSKVSRAGYMDRARVDELKRWTAENTPGATSAAISIALVSAALRAESIDVDERIMVLFNNRRYLDPAQQGSHGNFAVGIPLRIPAATSPHEIAGIMREVIESGWPIAILGMSQLRDATSRIRSSGRQQHADSVTEVSDTLRLAVSDLGKLRIFDHLEWADDAGPPQVAASLEPDGPDGCTMLIAEVAGGRTYTASFCSEMVGVAVMDAALRRICEDPVALLRDAH
ncbi:putative uncharacterized protein [Rhodococcus sp. AW25M09]|uniref:hypothetical protein n=1 Tax=Rhodococcus sp. AW25M09 TaxID=1268303 RepID=UPI0002ABBC10|nr:hypothetical protein [Rhodococcus sp. AW25M09]CCQ15906.1 putative uncharacterized protein [Rhodococcus sp. AW25M09]